MIQRSRRPGSFWLFGAAAVFLAAGLFVWSGNARTPFASSPQGAKRARPSVKFFSSTDMGGAFRKGLTLVDERGLNYKVLAGRRDSAGEVEIHTHYTDIIYFTEGSAIFVTGGRIEHPRNVAPGEIRGESIEGGVAQQVEKGSLVVVPAGTPHWLTSVASPVVDLVVKVRTR